MKTIFADTFYFLALYYPDDQYHAKTVRVARQLKARLLTTDWVLTEVADALSKGESRLKVADLIRRVRSSPVWEIIPFSRDQFDAAIEFHSQHRDKEWTLTDCASFLIMQERGITEALTGDRHFEQAGFTALLK
ncbi:MAG TPA: PIN domain-containing protein [Candidatus Methylacidiphilales bacterium]|jgi:predicted nucleic acid-binding protein|nr:PIN domain-containing protein [Candidatus Methylacidiphilales bacterium]